MPTTTIPLRHTPRRKLAKDRPGVQMCDDGASSLDVSESPCFTMKVADAKLHMVGTVVSVVETGLQVAPAKGHYDPNVVGVVVEAFHDGDGSASARVAIGGLVRIRVSLDAGQITPGDLLVASDRAGIAVRARDHYRAIGAIVAKALEPVQWHEAPNGAEKLIHAVVMR